MTENHFLEFPYGRFVVPRQFSTKTCCCPQISWDDLISKLLYARMGEGFFFVFLDTIQNFARNPQSFDYNLWTSPTPTQVIAIHTFLANFRRASTLVLYDYEKIINLQQTFAVAGEKLLGIDKSTSLISTFYQLQVSSEHRRSKKLRLEHLINLSVFPETEILPALDEHKIVLRALYDEKKSAETLADVFSYLEKVDRLFESFNWTTKF